MNQKQYSLLLILVIVSGLIGGAVSSYLFQDKKIIEAEEIRLRSKTTTASATLRFIDGTPELVFLDEKKIERITIKTTALESGLVMKDQEGMMRVAIIASLEDNGILFRDRTGKERAALALNIDDAPILTMADNAGIHRLGFALVEADGRPIIALKNKNGAPIWTAP